MKRYGILLVALIVVLAAHASHSIAQTNVKEFTCIGTLTTDCSDGTTSLRHYSGANLPYVSVSGWFTAGDGGGGTFYRLGSTAAHCKSPSFISASSSVGSTTISGLGSMATNGLTVGELVSASGTGIQTEPGTEIASIPSGGTSVTVTLPLIGTTGTSLTSIDFTGDNWGTLIVDAGNDCYQKTNYRGDPHEYGAIGDGLTDDTIPIQYWLGAAGTPPTSFAPTAAPATNFGPWITTIPANYLVSSPLVCPPNANIEGPANLNPAGDGGSSPVQILAATLGTGTGKFTDTSQPALMMASAFCRISGIELNATAISDDFYLLTSGNVSNTSTTLDCVPSVAGVIVGMPIVDTKSDIPNFTTVVSVNVGGGTCMSTSQIVMSQPATATASGDGITITGLYTVGVAGTHVGIDTHALLTGGYNDVFCIGPGSDGLQIKDVEIIGSYDDGLALNGCSNVRVIGDLISGNGVTPSGIAQPPHGRGVSSQGSDIIISNGVIEQSGGIGLDLENAQQVSVTGMYFDNNGKQLPVSGAQTGAGLQIGNSTNVAIAANHFHRSGGYAPGSSHVYFLGTSDDINLAANVYLPDNNPNDATLKPSYDYDVATGTVLTNSHLYEQPPPQAAGAVFSAAASPILAPLQAPQYTNEITGLVMSVDTGNAQTVDIATGSAADSTHSSLITLPPVSGSPACKVNLSATGAGGLDVPSLTGGTTYNFFAISSAGGSNAGTPTTSCIASTSLSPNLSDASLSAYQLSTKAQAIGATLYNVKSVAGVEPGDGVTASFITGTATVNTVGTSTFYSGATGTTTGTGCSTAYTCFTLTAGTANLVTGMAVSDNSNNGPATTACSGPTGQNDLTNSATISVINPSGSPANTIALNTSIAAASDCFTISGGNTITLTGSSSGAPTQTAITINTGLYRMLGALRTTSSITPTIIPFTQDGDTFYLKAPVNDVSASVGTSAGAIALASVPSGISVEAMGRCVGNSATAGNLIFVFTPPVVPGTPSAFSTTPGFAVQTIASGNALTPYPYRLYTDTSTHIEAQANVASTLQCETDGWVWHRAQ